jgi:muramoyltetrapeptide carboxypeptidase LdcA involved in peptidoglycan recycling
MRELIKPRKLAPGDRVATVSLSWGGPGAFPDRYRAGVRQLQEAFGVEVVEMDHTLAEPTWLAAHPEARAEDLMNAFADPSIRGIISSIGGDDSIRLLPHLDLETIRTNPKVFLGYSDTTVSHFACSKAGIVSFFGPAILAGFAENGGLFPYLAESVRRTLFSAEPIGVIAPNQNGWTSEHLDWSEQADSDQRRRLNAATPWRYLQGEGVAEGRLIGGTLEVVEFLRGTSLWPDDSEWRDTLLFLETSEEAPPASVLARALRVYGAMGILDQISGLLFGRPGGGVESEFDAYDETILQVVAVEHGKHQLPVVTRMDFGHTDPMFLLPYGVRAQIDCDAGQFSILEGAVVD